MKNALVLLALVAVLALPFALRRNAAVRGEADDSLVVITPHNEAIRYEFGRAFAAWYQRQTGRTVRVDWRVVGGTSDIAKYLESAYSAAFELEWKRRGQPWSPMVQSSFQNARVGAAAPALAREARTAFLESDVGCGIDVFFGGDAYQFDKEAGTGRLIDAGVRTRHPELFRDDVIPAAYGGEPFRDPDGRWFGLVLSSYGILYNRDSWSRLRLGAEPRQWRDMARPELAGEIGLADPTKSGSVCEAFEAIIQQQMQRRLQALDQGGRSAGEAAERKALSDGWTDGLRLIQLLGANARYFTDSSQKPPIDVANGDCAAGLCIDFYGRQQQEAVRRRGATERLGFTIPVGGSAASTDPIGILRGAPHRTVAIAFVEYTLSMEGQKLWAFRPGTEGGPERYALRRTPIRRDFYGHSEWQALRSDPDDDPYRSAVPFVYHAEWTGRLFREIGWVTRILCQDNHAELAAARRDISRAPEPRRSRALAVLQDVSAVSYERTGSEIHDVLSGRDRIREVQLASELARHFAVNYSRAGRIARGDAAEP